MSEDSIDPPRNFTITTEDRVRALTIGAPAYALRKKGLEDKEGALIAALLLIHDKEVARGRDPTAAVRTHASTVNFEKLNVIVAKHNRWYPIEANLPIDPATGGFLLGGRPWEREPEWTVERLICAFEAALAAREE